MSFDPRDDFTNVVDGLQPVTLLRPGSFESTSVKHALRRSIRTREAQPADGQYTASDVAWHLPDSEVSDPPRPGDLIVDSQMRRWTILRVRQATLGGRWRCVARDLALAHGLDQTICIDKATYEKSESGAAQPTWRLWLAGVRARIQPLVQQHEARHERLASACAFRVFVADDLPIDHTCRIRGPQGETYRVLGYRKAQRIDALGEIDVELES